MIVAAERIACPEKIEIETREAETIRRWLRDNFKVVVVVDLSDGFIAYVVDNGQCIQVTDLAKLEEIKKGLKKSLEQK